MQRKQLQIQSLGAGFYWEPLLSNKNNTIKGRIKEVIAINLRKPSGLDLPAIYNPLLRICSNCSVAQPDTSQRWWSSSNVDQIFIFCLKFCSEFVFFFYSKYLFHFRNPQAASVYQVVLRGQMV